MTAYEYLFHTKNENFYAESELAEVDWDYNYLLFLRDLQVILPADEHEYSSYVRRPYYQMRGKPLEGTVAKQLIDAQDKIKDINFGTIWVHTSGLVGINDHTGKYPTGSEFVSEWASILYQCPTLDLVVALTDWDEYPTNALDNLSEIDKYAGYSAEPEFLNEVRYGIWVHSGCIELLSAAKARKVYSEYSNLYSTSDPLVYNPLRVLLDKFLLC